MSLLDRYVAAMMAARARATGRTLEQVEEDIHRERLANLEPPELAETLDQYIARMVHEHGTTYADAATERYQGADGREARATAATRAVLTGLMRKSRGST